MDSLDKSQTRKIEDRIKSLPLFPSMVVASITNKCNYKCVHCKHETYASEESYQEHHMKFGIFKKIVDEVMQHPKCILRICAWGEPCTHPDIVDFVKYTKNRVKNTVLLTNGYYLTASLTNKLMAAGLKLIEISVDAACLEVYRKIRPSNDRNAFEKVVNNIQAAIKDRNRHKFATKIVVSYVTWPNRDSENDYSDFEKRWKNIADDVVKRRITSFCGQVDSDCIEIPKNRIPCYGLWARCNINPWGKIQVCYNQWERDMWDLGGLNQPSVTIANTWSNSSICRMRQRQLSGEYTGPCENCIDYNPHAWDHPFEEVYYRNVIS